VATVATLVFFLEYNTTKVNTLSYTLYHIDIIITEGGREPWRLTFFFLRKPWRLTCVYGEAQLPERHKTWDILKFIKSSSPLPWLCIGDFNKALHMGTYGYLRTKQCSN
jgi:hypothetical protein